MRKNRIALMITGGTIVGSLLLSNASAAATSSTAPQKTENSKIFGRHMSQKPAIYGSVVSINENIITVRDFNNVIHTIDAANAVIDRIKDKTTETIPLSNVKVGDSVAVMGTMMGNTFGASRIAHMGNGIGPSFRDKIASPNQLTILQKEKGISSTTPYLIGIINEVNSNAFTVTVGKGHNDLNVAPGEKFLVLLGPSTVFMKNGQLDSLNDLSIGQRVYVYGDLGSSSNTINALGVHVMTHRMSNR